MMAHDELLFAQFVCGVNPKQAGLVWTFSDQKRWTFII